MDHLHMILLLSILILNNTNSLTMASKLTGMVTFDGNSKIAPNSTVHIKMIDISRADAPSKTIGILFLNSNIK